MAENFTPIETQEALDEIVNAKINENTKAVTDSVTASVSKKFEGYISPDDFKSKTAEFETTISDLTAKNKAFEQNSLKLKAAHEFGIPFELSGRIAGDDEKSIREDAEKLSKFLSAKNTPPAFNPEKDPSKHNSDSALRKTIEKLKGE